MMSGNNINNSSREKYEKMSKKLCCGIKMKGVRLNSRRFSVQRLRNHFLYMFRVLRRWKNSYNNCLRLLRRSLVVMTRRRRRRRRRNGGLVHRNYYEQFGGSGCGLSSSSYSVVRTMNHSNSFCSEAIADCLEFIKRNSISIQDDDTNPMLKLNQD